MINSLLQSAARKIIDWKYSQVIDMVVTTILTIVVLNIFLPTADVITDINLMVKLCIFSHYKLATVLLMPFLLNYIVCFYTFFRLTTNRKRYTIIFPLLNLYPQYGKTHPS